MNGKFGEYTAACKSEDYGREAYHIAKLPTKVPLRAESLHTADHLYFN